MKAAYYMRNGGPEVMEYGDVPDPIAREGQVVVDVYAASVNAADWKARSGQHGTSPKFPYIPGRDFSGVVSALGAGVTDLSIGDEVFGVVEQVDNESYAEKVAIRAAIVNHRTDICDIDALIAAVLEFGAQRSRASDGRVPTIEHSPPLAM